jgi:hypothetical protein
MTDTIPSDAPSPDDIERDDIEREQAQWLVQSAVGPNPAVKMYADALDAANKRIAELEDRLAEILMRPTGGQ